jgi:hypothetical protein
MTTKAKSKQKKAYKENHKTNKAKKTGKTSNAKSTFLLVIIALIIPVAAIWFLVSNYGKNHSDNNTDPNVIDTSNMTSATEEDQMDEAASYSLMIVGRNGLSDTITGDEIDLHTDTTLKFNEELLKETVNKLVFLEVGNIIDPTNAGVSEYGSNGYEIVPESQGSAVMEDKLYGAVLGAVNSLQPSLDIDVAGCYAKPEITSDNPGLANAVNEMNKLAGSEITYQFGDATEILDGSKISEWLSVDSNFEVHLNGDGVKAYVDYIGKTYNTFGKIREFQTSYGDVLQIKGGDYGWWLNRPAEVEELTQLIQNGEQLVKTPVYFQTAQQYGPDDIGNTYVEVNLTAQHLFFYKDGELILDTDFVSGNLSKGWGTPVGTYPVQYKDNDATLVGEDYETPVKYWMPFNKNIGFHDAYWRDEFGKDIYLTSGSHGCINMPPKMAKKMYQNIKRGVAVVVYELPGTENYEVKEGQTNTDGTGNTDTTGDTGNTGTTEDTGDTGNTGDHGNSGNTEVTDDSGSN